MCLFGFAGKSCVSRKKGITSIGAWAAYNRKKCIPCLVFFAFLNALCTGSRILHIFGIPCTATLCSLPQNILSRAALDCQGDGRRPGPRGGSSVGNLPGCWLICWEMHYWWQGHLLGNALPVAGSSVGKCTTGGRVICWEMHFR